MTHRLSKVYIDNPDAAYDCYVVVGQHWNGWAIPVFTREQADVWMAAYSKIIEKFPFLGVSYDESLDAYIVKDEDNGMEDEVFEGEDLVIEGKTLHVYEIGAYCWTWTEVDAAPTKPYPPKSHLEQALDILDTMDDDITEHGGDEDENGRRDLAKIRRAKDHVRRAIAQGVTA